MDKTGYIYEYKKVLETIKGGIEMDSVKRARWISLIIGILLIINGIIFIANPIESVITLVNVIAVSLIAIGVLRVIRYFTNDMFKSGVFLVGGILDVILGILIVSNQSVSVVTFTTFIGFWQLFSGVSEIVVSIDVKRLGLPRWWLGLISGILGIILGFMLIRNLVFTSVYISMVVGIYMLVFGITFISTFFGLNKFIRNR